VEHRPSSLVPAQSQLALDLESGETWRVGCHQVRCAKPVAQRCTTPVHHRPRSGRHLVPAAAALQKASRGNLVRVTMPTPRALVPFGPARLDEEISARFLRAEPILELFERTREVWTPQFRSLRLPTHYMWWFPESTG
jgi:hypothetical protein